MTWCHDIRRDAAVRAAEDNRTGVLPTLEEAIAMIPKSGSVSNTVEHENKGQSMATKSEIQPADYQAEASERVAPAGLRTERVTLELPPEPEPSVARVTLELLGRFDSHPASWPWEAIFSHEVAVRLEPGDSVRVVDEPAIRSRTDGEALAYAQGMAAVLVIDIQSQRDTAIREREDAARNRDRLHGELGDCRQKLTAAETLAESQKDMMTHYVNRIAFWTGQCELRESALKKAEARVSHLEDANRALMDAANTASDMIDELEAERDEAIREREEAKQAHRDYEHFVMTGRNEQHERLVAAKELAEARVAELEAQLESVADRAAAAETALDARTSTAGEDSCAAQAASSNSQTALEGSQAAGGGGEQLREQVASIVHEAMRFYRVAETATWQGGNSFGEDRARQAAAEIAELMQAASGGREGEPDCWAIENDEAGAVAVSTIRETAEWVAEECNAETSDRGGPYSVVPRFRAPPQPRGWLTKEQREFLVDLAIRWRHMQPVGTGSAAERASVDRMADMIDSILARSTPPEVVLPPLKGEFTGRPWAVAGYNSAIQMCRAALAAAGVEVKEVPRE